jgi:hypothetical protein
MAKELYMTPPWKPPRAKNTVVATEIRRRRRLRQLDERAVKRLLSKNALISAAACKQAKRSNQ